MHRLLQSSLSWNINALSWQAGTNSKKAALIQWIICLHSLENYLNNAANEQNLGVKVLKRLMLLTEQGGKKVEWKFTSHIFHIGLCLIQTTRKEIKYEKRDFCMKLRYLKMFLKFKPRSKSPTCTFQVTLMILISLLRCLWLELVAKLCRAGPDLRNPALEVLLR